MSALFDSPRLVVDLPVPATARISVAGRRVTGQIELPERNPFGMRRLKVDYQRPASWSPENERSIIRIAVTWFARIGGLVRLTAPIGKHIHAKLAEWHEKWLLAAVNAYADSEWHRQHRKWMSHRRFFKDDGFQEWMLESPEFKAEMERQQRAERSSPGSELNRRLQDLNRQRSQQQHAQPGADKRLRSLSPVRREEVQARAAEYDRDDRADQRRRQAAAVTQRQEDRQARCRKIWESLPPGRQDRILRLIRNEAEGRGMEMPHDMSNFAFRTVVYTYVERTRRQLDLARA